MTYAKYLQRVADDIAIKPSLNDGVEVPWQQVAQELVDACIAYGVDESVAATELLEKWKLIVVPNRAALMAALHDAYQKGKHKAERMRKGQASIFDLLT